MTGTPQLLPLPPAGPKQLYTVLEQQKANVGAGTLMGSEHTYVIPGAGGAAAGKEKLSIAAQVSTGAAGGLELWAGWAGEVRNGGPPSGAVQCTTCATLWQLKPS